MVRLVNRVCDCGFVLQRKRRIQPRIAGLILTHFNYGLGVVNRGPWVTQTKNLAGAGATVGYLRSKHLAIAVSTT